MNLLMMFLYSSGRSNFDVFFMSNVHNLLVLWLVFDFHCMKLSLDVRNMMSLNFLMLLRVFSNGLLLVMCWGRLQLNWDLFSLCNCYNMRFLVINSFIVFILVIWLTFLDL